MEDVSCSNCMAYSGERESIEHGILCSPRRLNGLVLLVIGGRSNAYCAFSRACSTRCYRSMVALHRSLVPVISWLSSPAPWITYCLGDFVVPFSNAKVVGSFRMARLNMFRRKVLLKISPALQVVNFAEVLLITEWWTALRQLWKHCKRNKKHRYFCTHV